MSEQESESFKIGVFYNAVNCFNQCVTQYDDELISTEERNCFESCTTEIGNLFREVPKLYHENKREGLH